MIFAVGPPLAAIGFNTWQSWAGVACLCIALVALVTGLRSGGWSAARGSLLSGNPATQFREKVCAVLMVLSIIGACALFVWSTHDSVR
jgi:hypothetical protein